jgi:hypothetical protein
MMGLKASFPIKMVCFRFYPQYSSIPFFHSDGINRLPLTNLYFRKIVEFPGCLIRRGDAVDLIVANELQGWPAP